MQIELPILELLASKICHDLVSPVGAINNGVELIDDVGGGVIDEAMKLISSSAEQASRRLRLFRLAYGRAGSDSNLTFKDARETLEAHFQGSKIKLAFAPDFPAESLTERRGALKALLNCGLLAEEALVYGGDILVGPGSGGFAGGASLTASGRNAALTAAALQALAGETPAGEITPRTVHAYVTGKFLKLHGFRYAVDNPQAEQVALHYAPEVIDTAAAAE